MIDDRAYKRLRELVDTKGSVLDAVESVVGAWWDEGSRELQADYRATDEKPPVPSATSTLAAETASSRR